MAKAADDHTTPHEEAESPSNKRIEFADNLTRIRDHAAGLLLAIDGYRHEHGSDGLAMGLVVLADEHWRRLCELHDDFEELRRDHEEDA